MLTFTTTVKRLENGRGRVRVRVTGDAFGKGELLASFDMSPERWSLMSSLEKSQLVVAAVKLAITGAPFAEETA